MVKRALWMVVGSIAVSAACAASRANNDGPIGYVVDSAVDAVLDVLGVDTTVTDAKADDASTPPTDAAPPKPVPPTVDTAACDVSAPPWLYARKSYPGRTDVELSLGSAIVCGGLSAPDGHCSASSLYVKDGSVMVLCGAFDGSWKATSVRFVMP